MQSYSEFISFVLNIEANCRSSYGGDGYTCEFRAVMFIKWLLLLIILNFKSFKIVEDDAAEQQATLVRKLWPY